LNGEDVKRKLLILLRSAWIRIEDHAIELSWLVDPNKYQGLEANEFLEAIASEDMNISISVKNAKKNWLIPRFIASYINQKWIEHTRVWLQFIPKESQIGQLKWTANKILIHTSQRTPYGSSPHEITSPGAWTIKTAASVRADLLYLLNGTNLWQHS
jgi:homoserine dehydrogenase